MPDRPFPQEIIAELAELDAAAGFAPPPPPVVVITIDDDGHAEVDSQRPRTFVAAALRHLADRLEAGE